MCAVETHERKSPSAVLVVAAMRERGRERGVGGDVLSRVDGEVWKFLDVLPAPHLVQRGPTAAAGRVRRESRAGGMF